MSAHKTRFSSNGDPVNTLVLGSIAGSLLGAGLALFLAPKSGKALRRDLCHACQEIAEKGQDLKEEIMDRGQHLFEKVHPNKSSKCNAAAKIISGGVVGALLGASAIALAKQQLNGSSAEEESLISRAGNLVRKTNGFLQSLSETLSAQEGRLQQEETKTNRVDDIVELANIGLRLFQSFKKRS